MVSTHPYLNFNGDCKAAFELYAKVLGGKLDVQTFGESPAADQAPPGWKDKVVHARLTLSDSVLMASDAPHDRYEKPAGIHVSINVNDAAEADRIFSALAEGGAVSMPIQETFWAERFGMCVDRFGTPWMVNCEKAMAAVG